MSVGVTLAGLRDRIADLAAVDGAYYVVCGRTGHRPAPVAGRRFDDRAAARRAASAATEYRATLRRYDPQVPHHDLIVCQRRDQPTTEPGHACPGTDRAQRSLSYPVLTGDTSTERRNRLVERCHRVAAATFESLSDCGHRAAERATMDRYTELAEALPTPDGLCLCLLESMAATLSERLDGAAQAAVLARAADRLEPRGDGGAPVATAFADLRACGVVGGFSPPEPVTASDGSGTAGVRVSEYALSPREGRLPVLPVVVDLFGRLPDRPPRWVRAVPLGEGDGAGWRLDIGFGGRDDPEGLLNAPIRSPA